MTREEFAISLADVEAALQGEMTAPFTEFLFREFGAHDADLWRLTCRQMVHSQKQARQVVFRDFEMAIARARERMSLIRHRKNAGQEREGKIVDLGSVAKGILARIKVR